MFLSKTTEYAVRILIYMAAKDNDLYKTGELSQALKIPYKYLTKIMTDLARHDFITSVKGRSGGFTIAKPLTQITLYDIVNAVEGADQLHSCILGFPDCSPENPCALHYLYEENKEAMIKTMKTTTLDYFRKNRDNIKRF